MKRIVSFDFIEANYHHSPLVAICYCLHGVTYRLDKQEAQLPQRDSASATHVSLGSHTDRALH